MNPAKARLSVEIDKVLLENFRAQCTKSARSQVWAVEMGLKHMLQQMQAADLAISAIAAVTPTMSPTPSLTSGQEAILPAGHLMVQAATLATSHSSAPKVTPSQEGRITYLVGPKGVVRISSGAVKDHTSDPGYVPPSPEVLDILPQLTGAQLVPSSPTIWFPFAALAKVYDVDLDVIRKMLDSSDIVTFNEIEWVDTVALDNLRMLTKLTYHDQTAIDRHLDDQRADISAAPLQAAA